MKIRDRIRELRRVPVASLRPHPHNWRTHSRSQCAALRGVLHEIGYASALLAFELPDGTLQLIDGHLRADAEPDAIAPVLVLDVDETEAQKILLTHDPLAEMAGVDAEQLAQSLCEVEFESPAVTEMLADKALGTAYSDASFAAPDSAEPVITESHQLVVDCGNETAQASLYQRLTQEGYACRVLTLP
ncbi:hypothetical protein OAS39_06235 [Pirellulales bacterium]|nr:hypothetical protein [Pirellulales bacterium]